MSPDTLLDLQKWIGRKQRVADEITAPAIARICGLLNLERPASLPPHWYSMFFPEIAPQSELGADGHPRTGDFLPPSPLPRRMLGGRRTHVIAPLQIGDHAEKESEIIGVEAKSGRTGALLIVTLRHTFRVQGSIHITEEQDVIYREAAVSGEAPVSPTPAPRDAAWQEIVTPTMPMLFRYSAITFNGHRIHYDADYSRDVEGYPACVVNGGLTLLLLLEAARRNSGKAANKYTARTARPLFAEQPITLAGDGSGKLWAANEHGDLAIQVEITP
ncbi:MAG: hypothetical protein ABW199_07950 [Caulobacterales bacterium]